MLTPQLKIDYAYTTTGISLNNAIVYWNVPLMAPILELDNCTGNIPNPLYCFGYIKKRGKFYHITPPDGINIRIYDPIDTRKQFTEI